MPRLRKEIWKTIPGWPNHQVSSGGRFRKKACRDGRGYLQRAHMLKVHVQKYDKAGHLRSFVCLYDRGRHKNLSAGVLVLTTFVGPKPTKKSVARHLDDDITNNNLSNLIWGSQKDNVADAIRNGKRITYGENVCTAKLSVADVQCIRATCRPWSRKFGVRVLAKQYGVDESTIASVVSAKSWKGVVDPTVYAK